MFALAVVAATPGLIGLSVFVAGIYLGGAHDGALRLDALVSLALAALVGWQVWHVYTRAYRAAQSRATELWLGALCAVALVVVAIASLAVGDRLSGHVVLEVVVTLVALALLGRAYVPKASYDGLGDPFSFRGELDQMHASVGIATVLPRLLLESWGEVFSGNLAVKVPAHVVSRAAELISRARGVAIPVSGEDGPAVRLLTELKLASALAGSRVELTMNGRDFLAAVRSGAPEAS